MNRIFTRSLVYDEETDEYIVEIPDEICEELDLHPGDVMIYEYIKDKIVLRKRLEV
jgi:bifunctional DNA-binding transcriptional regulator/antitoxin component of YhaV-PrlF toxin-antitoxin module